MPITRYLSDGTITPEQRRIIEQAFDGTLRKLHLVDRNDPVCAIVAQKVIEVHKRGVSDPTTLAELTVREIGPPK